MIIKPKGIICVTCKEPLGWDSRALIWGTVHSTPSLEYVQSYVTHPWGGHDHWPMPVDQGPETSD